MKTFREFIIEAKDAIKDYTYMGDAAEQRRVARNNAHIDWDKVQAEARRKAKEELLRNRSKNTKVSGQNIRGGKPPTGTSPRSSAIVRSGPSALSTNVKPPVQQIRTNLNVPGGRKIPGLKSGGAISAVLGTADEKMKGSGWARSLARGAATGTGAVLGGIVGGTAGTAIAPGAGTAIGGYVGQAAGAAAADKAFDVAAGANAKERAAMAQSNRQRQAGGALKGIGGKTTFDTTKNTMTTGSGSQRRTVQLGKTSVVTGPKGEKSLGHLAYSKGQAVYKRAADPSTLARTSSNPWERVGRTLGRWGVAPFASAYKKHDKEQQAAALKRASTSDIKRQRALGVKGY